MSKYKAGIPFIFVTLVLDSIGLGLIIPVLPRLVEQFAGGGPSAASSTYGLLISAYSLAQFLFSPMMGSLSDQYGRRPIILLTLAGATIDYGLMALAGSLPLLFIGRLIAGFCGANFTTASAYIADVTPPEKRTEGFGMIGMAFGIGFVVGPAIGGLLGDANPRMPFWIAGGLTLINVVYGLFVLPESLDMEHRRKFKWKDANPFGTIPVLGKFGLALGLAISFFFMELAALLLHSTWVLFNEYKFNWSTTEVGLSLAMIGVLIGVVQGFMAQKIVDKIGEQKTIMAGYALLALTYLLFGLATQSWMMFAILIPQTIGFAGQSALQGLITKQVPANEQGQVQGAVTSMLSLAAIIGPIIGTFLFGYFTSPKVWFQIPGASFFGGAVLYLIAMAIAARTFAKAEKVGS